MFSQVVCLYELEEHGWAATFSQSYTFEVGPSHCFQAGYDPDESALGLLEKRGTGLSFVFLGIWFLT
jgi:hypothetical protein